MVITFGRDSQQKVEGVCPLLDCGCDHMTSFVRGDTSRGWNSLVHGRYLRLLPGTLRGMKPAGEVVGCPGQQPANCQVRE